MYESKATTTDSKDLPDEIREMLNEKYSKIYNLAQRLSN